MTDVKVYTREDIHKLTRKRSGEIKLGELVDCALNDWVEELKQSKAQYVILGIPEDIGVRANYGRGGAHTAFKPALESFLNQQHNQFLEANTVFILGELVVGDLMHQAAVLDLKNKNDIIQLRLLVAEIDKRLSEVIRIIVSMKKIPIVIGGGHNNAYGNIKGAQQALGNNLNVINCDPHLDFRELEGRHSGNGFSYAFEEGYLNRYAVFAMHESYNNQQALEKFKKHPTQLFYNTYESVFVKEEIEFNTALQQTIGYVKSQPCGVEIDLDAITNVPSSAKTSSGISPLQARRFIYESAKQLNCVYLHIAEGAPVLSHIKADNKTGKLIAYLVSDFIKGNSSINKSNSYIGQLPV